ncbi:MAG: putative PurR-regulated permease PerM [Polaribacter sp.]|jgi:predicted PurR-regulated permease PerM
MTSQKVNEFQTELKKTSPFVIFFFVLFVFILLALLIVASILISPFALIGYIFYLLFPFFKDLYRINKNYKYDIREP